MTDVKQPLFGDGRVPNLPGNNGYGFEEHEHFVNPKAEETPAKPKIVKPDLKKALEDLGIKQPEL